MKTPRSVRWSPLRGSGWVSRSAALACILTICAANGRAQTPSTPFSRIDTLRGQIEQAADNHATDERLGRLWLQLANAYQTELQFEDAEQAFGQALSLLRSPATQPAYANALNGLGSIYMSTRRLPEALNCLQKSEAIYKALGDRGNAARVRESAAIALLAQGRSRDGERESSAALKDLEAEPKPDIDQMSMALLTHSYSLCIQHRCEAALDDVERASTLVQATFPAESLPAAMVWLGRGFDQWKLGSTDQAERSLREGLRIAMALKDEAPSLITELRLNALQQYDNYLKATHRKPEAREVEDQIAQLRSVRPSGCRECTVHVSALLPATSPR